MKKTILLISFAVLAVFLCAQGNYYDNVINLTGNQLYTALRTLISTNTYSSYDGAKVYLFQTLDNVNGNVTCIYTGQVYNVGYNYTGSTNPNTEHTYAQSWFTSTQSSIKKADLHHLFPSNSVVNSSRGNLPLFTVANHASANVYYNNTPWQSYRGNSATGYTVFEAADETKGNIARALLYFNTRYNDTLTQQNITMTPVLVQWHYQDPPDAREIARNQGIYTFQGNRNPFIDHPEFVGRIWGGSDVEDPIVPVSGHLTLSNVAPNPFHDSTTLSIYSQKSGSLRTEVFNVRGQRVWQSDANLPAGESQVTWNGLSDDGKRVPNGIYLVRVTSGDASLTTKLLLK